MYYLYSLLHISFRVKKNSFQCAKRKNYLKAFTGNFFNEICHAGDDEGGGGKSCGQHDEDSNNLCIGRTHISDATAQDTFCAARAYITAISVTLYSTALPLFAVLVSKYTEAA